MTGKDRKRWIVLGSVVAILIVLQIFFRLDLWIAGAWNWETDPIPAATRPFVAAGATTSSGPTSMSATRPADWAQPVQAAGLSNFFKVSDDLYRGAQTGPEGFATLKKMGIKTVVNLRFMHSDRDMLPENGLKYIHINFDPFHPEKEDVREFLKIVRDPTNRPIFVHCQHGSDRTGTMVAVYRTVIQGWTMEKALQEMTQGDFGYHEQWVNLIQFLRQLDVDELRKVSGTASQTQTTAPHAD